VLLTGEEGRRFEAHEEGRRGVLCAWLLDAGQPDMRLLPAAGSQPLNTSMSRWPQLAAHASCSTGSGAQQLACLRALNYSQVRCVSQQQGICAKIEMSATFCRQSDHLCPLQPTRSVPAVVCEFLQLSQHVELPYGSRIGHSLLLTVST